MSPASSGVALLEAEATSGQSAVVEREGDSPARPANRSGLDGDGVDQDGLKACAEGESASTESLATGIFLEAGSRPDRARVVVAKAGDHPSVFQLLTAVFQGPSHDAFLASLEDPFYEPCDRLLVKHGTQVAAHLHLTKRVMHFGPLRLGVSGLGWLGTLPEFRGHGYARRLLATAEGLMREEGSELGMLRTRIPRYFRRDGWAVCTRRCWSRAGTRELLAQMQSQRSWRTPTPLNIRPWRQVELPALMRIYRQNIGEAFGALDRTEPYWRWLGSRKGFDQILVAIDGPDRLELEDTTSPIVGYAVAKDDQIIELLSAPDHPHARVQLLIRACSEAIERDVHALSLHSPAHDPLHELFQLARGTQWHHESFEGEYFMVKLLDPIGFLRRLCPELHRRASDAALVRPCELGLVVEGRRHLLAVSRRSVKLLPRRTGRSYLRCNVAEFTRLVLGHVEVDEAVRLGRLQASTRMAVDVARVLFPRLPLWRPPLDDL